MVISSLRPCESLSNRVSSSLGQRGENINQIMMAWLSSGPHTTHNTKKDGKYAFSVGK